MAEKPEERARAEIDRLLAAAGWSVQSMSEANIHAARGVAIREFPLKIGHGFADYLLYIDAKAAGVIEAKKEGVTLTGVEPQSARYAEGLPHELPAWNRPLPFSYQSTGVETHFTNGLDPEPRARPTFAFHRPDSLRTWLDLLPAPTTMATGSGAPAPAAAFAPPTFLSQVRHLPPLVETGLWSAQIRAIRNLEASLAADKPRALIQMATGSGKTYTAISFIYRLIKFAGARRVLFLVDRGNLGRQTKKEFDQYASPYNNYKFGEEYIVQHLTSNTLDTTARVTICTIQRLYSMLKGRELAEEDDEVSAAGLENLFKSPEPIAYNPSIPIETFDVIVTDEAHRSIYNLWRQVLEYFDAHLIGLTATPSKQTFGFFNQNLVMEYGHEQAVADGVNVNYDVYRIRTEVTESGGKVEAGYYVDLRDRDTRKVRWQELDEDFDYDPNQLDREVVTPDQIRTIVRTFRDKTDSRPLDQKKSVSFEKLLQAVALGNTEPEVLSSVAARLSRLDESLSEGDKTRIAQASGGATLKALARDIVDALNPDQSAEAASQSVLQAVKPLFEPGLRNLLIELKKQSEQIIDTVTQDKLLEATFSAAARERAKGVVESFERFIVEHKDEITALQILYNRPQRTQGAPLTFDALKNLADALQAPPRLWTESQLWQAYAALDKSKVKGENRRRILTDLVSLVRFAMHQDNELVPFPERVNVNFKAWLVGASSAREQPFSEDQIKWLTMIRDHIAANLGIEADDFELSPFAQEGGIGKVHQLFGTELPEVLSSLNGALAA